MESINDFVTTLEKNGIYFIGFLYLNPELEDYYEHLKLLKRTLTDPEINFEVQGKIESEEHRRRLRREMGPYFEIFDEVFQGSDGTDVFIGDIKEISDLQKGLLFNWYKEEKMIVFSPNEVNEHLQKKSPVDINDDEKKSFIFKRIGDSSNQIPENILKFIYLVKNLEKFVIVEVYDFMPDLQPQPIMKFKTYPDIRFGNINVISSRYDMMYFDDDPENFNVHPKDFKVKQIENGIEIYLTGNSAKKLKEFREKNQ